MNTEFIKGVVVPIITVIDQDEKIDEAGMRKQVDYVIDGGLQGKDGEALFVREGGHGKDTEGELRAA